MTVGSRLAAGVARSRPPVCRGADPSAAVRCARRAVDLRAGDQGRPTLSSRTFGAGQHLVALGYDSRAKDAAARAFELSANLPRADRLLVEGTYREMSSAWKEAIAIWQTLATFFPDDVEHALRLANAQISSGAAKDGLATIEGFRKRFPAIDGSAARSRRGAGGRHACRISSGCRPPRPPRRRPARGSGATLLVANARCARAAPLRQGQTDQAVQLFEEARAIYAAAGDKAGVARTLNNLATAISDGPDTKRTRALYEEGLRIARSIGEQDLVARFLNNIADPGAASRQSAGLAEDEPGVAGHPPRDRRPDQRRDLAEQHRQRPARPRRPARRVAALRGVGGDEPRDGRSPRPGTRAVQRWRVAEAAGRDRSLAGDATKRHCRFAAASTIRPASRRLSMASATLPACRAIWRRPRGR